MKFLCMTCDEPMSLQKAAPPAEGSISAVFACPTCSHQIAMLMNPHETQMVQSLGVKIGPGNNDAAQPTSINPAAMPAGAPAAHAGMAAGDAQSTAEAAKAGGCPFSGMLADMANQDASVTWTPEALERLANVPDFVRPMARQGIEHYAKNQGLSVINAEFMEEARGRFGM